MELKEQRSEAISKVTATNCFTHHILSPAYDTTNPTPDRFERARTLTVCITEANSKERFLTDTLDRIYIKDK